MMGIIGLIALLTILGLSLVITRVATVALMLTGLSEEASRFQARSAFTGTGFTTREAEHVVDHPVRRRIIMTLMLLRSAGLISILLSLMLSFAGSKDTEQLFRLFWFLAGLLVLWLLAWSQTVDVLLKRLMNRFLSRWTDLDVRDYVGLLKLSGDYVIREWQVEGDDWVVGKDLQRCRLHDEGVSVLGIYRENGSYVGVPEKTTRVRAGDSLILYGRSSALERLSKRHRGGEGDDQHAVAVSEQQLHRTQDSQEDRA